VECGPIFIVATTALEDTPEFEWMKMTTRLPQTPNEFNKAVRLISENINDKIQPEDLEKTMFDFMYVDGVNVLTYAEEQKKAAEEQKKAAEEQKRFAEEVSRELQEARREIEALKAELKGTVKSDE
jgi:translation initiation factor IF-2